MTPWPRLALVAGTLLLPGVGGAAPVGPPHEDVACTACHPRGPDRAAITCTSGECHAAEASRFHASAHDRAHLGEPDPGECAACHGGHETRSGLAALAAACEARLDSTCLSCHPADRYVPRREGTPLPGGLARSIHARARDSEGCVAAALTCYACHGPHAVLEEDLPESPVHRSHVAATCGRCHPEAWKAYEGSAHAAALEAGSPLAPTCASCHGAHGVQASAGGHASTSAGRVVFTCAECHEDPAVTRASGLPEGVVESYDRTFHGVVYAHGISDVATCVSCHGAHDVLPSSDPRSRTYPTRVRATCEGCHSGVDEAMVARVSHPSEWPGLRKAVAGLNLYFPVAGTAVNPALVAGMGGAVGFLSGLFGVGGGFLMTPLLIFIGIPAAVAAATDAAQITAGASSGALSHSRLGNVDFKMGSIIVIGGWTGGYTGVQLVALLRHLGNFDFYLKLMYVVVLGFIGTGMFVEGVRTLRVKASGDEPGRGRLSRLFARLPLQMSFPSSGLKTSALLPIAAGFVVGVLAAFLGVGGGFIMLPAMIYLIGIPTRVAVGTDLFQIVLTSSNVALQQAITNHTVDVLLAVMLFAGSTIGAQFGVLASRRLRGEQIRVFLALIVLAVMAVLLYQLLATPEFLVDLARAGGGH